MATISLACGGPPPAHDNSPPETRISGLSGTGKTPEYTAMKAPREKLRVLTIGNSFTDSLGLYWQQVVESAGCWLQFERANHGGCELHRHWGYVESEERDAECRMYHQGRFKLRELLAQKPWDIVTLQQASHASWREETYQPFATNLLNYVRTHAPGAEVVIQQTWAYRADDPRLADGGEWGIGQTEMYERFTRAYGRLSRELGGLRVIPSGYAVQLTRRYGEGPFRSYDPGLLQTLRWPDLPSQAGDVVGSMGYQKNRETGELEIWRDSIHLNNRGQYLQACVWFAFLYGRNTSMVTYRPDSIGDRDAAFLRDMAQRAVDEFVLPAPA